MEERERTSVIAALAVVVLSIAAFVAFALNGSGAVFFAIALLAIVVGFYMSYRISMEAKAGTRVRKRTKR